jgi:hypothetical protein
MTLAGAVRRVPLQQATPAATVVGGAGITPEGAAMTERIVRRAAVDTLERRSAARAAWAQVRPGGGRRPCHGSRVCNTMCRETRLEAVRAWQSAARGDYRRTARTRPRRRPAAEVTCKGPGSMMTKEVDPLLMELEPLSITDTVGFKPDFIVLDSLTAISSTFQGKEQSYRFYVERLFRFFEKIGATTFLITETQQIPEVFSPTGVEEFLADGVVVIYNIRRQNTRENAIEVLKMRGVKHQKKIVSMSITEKGIVVNPNKEVYSEIE